MLISKVPLFLVKDRENLLNIYRRFVTGSGFTIVTLLLLLLLSLLLLLLLLL